MEKKWAMEAFLLRSPHTPSSHMFIRERTDSTLVPSSALRGKMMDRHGDIGIAMRRVILCIQKKF